MSLPENRARFAKDRFITMTDGTPIAYTVVGDGPNVPILFVNGWSCTDTYWRDIGPAVVAAGHPSVFVDTRGHGESGLPRPAGFNAWGLRPEDVSVERIAADFVEVLDDAGIEVAALAGHSLGVQLIFEIYRQVPGRVAALLPVAGTFENPVKTFADKPVLDRLFPVADVVFRMVPFGFLQPAVRRISQPQSALKALRAIKVAGPKVTAEQIGPHVAQICDIDFAVLWRMIGSFRAQHTAELLPAVAVPTLVFAGAKDAFAPPSVQRRMKDLIPESEIVWFDEGGHMLPVEEPDAIASAILDFLRRRVAVGSMAVPAPSDRPGVGSLP